MDRSPANAKRNADQAFLVRPPDPSLPNGGGVIRGIGEKISADPVTGTGSFSVPIATSPGCAGFAPQLALDYDSGAGDGPFALGWNLGLPSVCRKTDKVVCTILPENSRTCPSEPTAPGTSGLTSMRRTLRRAPRTSGLSYESCSIDGAV